MARFKGTLKRDEGLSLIELLVVVAILGILASLTAVAVTGTTSSGKSVSKEGDENTVTKAASAYSAEQVEGRFPSLDGCLPGDKLLSSLICSGSGTQSGDNQQFTVDETVVSVDVNKDGDILDASVTVVPIIWNQYFETGDDQRIFKGDFLKVPKHGFELINGNSFSTNTEGTRPEDDVILTGVPDMTACASDADACPVWVFNEFSDAVALLKGGSY